MGDSEKIKMEINIGGREVQIRVPFDKQDSVRDLEKEVEHVFAGLRKNYPRKDTSEILAMIVYRYASYYHDLTDLHAEVRRVAEECCDALDDILLSD